MPRKVMICAGETSGELYGALLSREIKKNWPDTEIFGIGGRRMELEGVSLVAPTSHVIGIIEVLKHLSEVRLAFRKAREALTSRKPDVLVLIDYPDFNIALAKKAKAAGIPILYYVSPQVWAWRRGRVRKIAALVTRMAVLFPFEVDYYRNVGLPCEFVGHPITETLNIERSKEDLKQSLGLDPDWDVIALLPGSRPSEIRKHQALLRQLARRIREEFPRTVIVVPLVSGSTFSETLPEDVRIIYDRTAQVVACSEATAVASGTATLETALVGTPMVVFYKVSFFTYHLVKLLAKVRFVSLVNLLSDKQVVIELLQRDATVDNIFSELKRLVKDIPYRNDMISNLRKIQDIMAGKSPSARVAAIVGEIAGWNSTAA